MKTKAGISCLVTAQMIKDVMFSQNRHVIESKICLVSNKNIKMSSFKSSENIQKKDGGPDRSVSDNQSSSVTLNELAMKARKILSQKFQIFGYFCGCTAHFVFALVGNPEDS